MRTTRNHCFWFTKASYMRGENWKSLAYRLWRHHRAGRKGRGDCHSRWHSVRLARRRRRTSWSCSRLFSRRHCRWSCSPSAPPRSRCPDWRWAYTGCCGWCSPCTDPPPCAKRRRQATRKGKPEGGELHVRSCTSTQFVSYMLLLQTLSWNCQLPHSGRRDIRKCFIKTFSKIF